MRASQPGTGSELGEFPAREYGLLGGCASLFYAPDQPNAYSRARSMIFPRAVTPVVVLVSALLLTASATAVVWRGAVERDRARFENAVQSATDRITSRMELYISLLRSGSALFAVEEVSRTEWRRYADRLGIQQRYPGVQGIGFSQRIHPDSIDELESRMRAEGEPGFRVWPDSARDEYHSILYLEPYDERNREAIGYDMYSEPVRRAAMQRAVQQGPTLSGKVTLVQEIDGVVQPGFLLYLPVFREGDIPTTAEARQEELIGFVYAPFRSLGLFAGTFGTEEAPRVHFQVYDGIEPDPANLLYDSRPTPAEPWPSGEFAEQVTLELGGRQWTLLFAPSATFQTRSNRGVIPIIAIGGLLGSLLLFGLSRSQERAQRMAEDANQAKSQFLANMSHELRTPLTAIGGYSEIMALGIHGPVTDDQRRDLARINHAQQRLLGLIDDLLGFAKIEAGRVDLHLETLPVGPIVDQAESLIDLQLRAKGLTYVRGTIDPEIRVVGDPEKVLQILVNLLSNAVKFTAGGGEVRIDCGRSDGTVEVCVRDTGRGIPADQVDAVFDPFVQVEPGLNRSSEGSGLGLAIARELARAMEGDLTVESQPGKGSSFVLSLPAATVNSSS